MSPSANGHSEAWGPSLGMQEETGQAVLPYCREKEAWPSTRTHGHWKSHTQAHTQIPSGMRDMQVRANCEHQTPTLVEQPHT